MWTYVAVQLPVILMGGAVGIWLFYVQHQFEPGYWARDESWNQLDAALLGASHYKLPPVLRWFTGNIGMATICITSNRASPNYRLRRAYLAFPEARVRKPLTLWRKFSRCSCESLERGRGTVSELSRSASPDAPTRAHVSGLRRLRLAQRAAQVGPA